MAAAAPPRNTAPFLEAAGRCATPAFEAALNTETTVATMHMRVVREVGMCGELIYSVRRKTKPKNCCHANRDMKILTAFKA